MVHISWISTVPKKFHPPLSYTAPHQQVAQMANAMNASLVNDVFSTLYSKENTTNIEIRVKTVKQKLIALTRPVHYDLKAAVEKTKYWNCNNLDVYLNTHDVVLAIIISAIFSGINEE